MVDILLANNNDEFELVLHFVNKERNPGLPPLIKRFFMTNDVHTKEFLKYFEAVASKLS